MGPSSVLPSRCCERIFSGPYVDNVCPSWWGQLLWVCGQAGLCPQFSWLAGPVQYGGCQLLVVGGQGSRMIVCILKSSAGPQCRDQFLGQLVAGPRCPGTVAGPLVYGWSQLIWLWDFRIRQAETIPLIDWTGFQSSSLNC